MTEGKLYSEYKELAILIQNFGYGLIKEQPEMVHFFKVLDSAKAEFPLKPVMEVFRLAPDLKDDWIKNANVKRFLEETIAWFEKEFGSK